jgi:hypothetical protein
MTMERYKRVLERERKRIEARVFKWFGYVSLRPQDVANGLYLCYILSCMIFWMITMCCEVSYLYIGLLTQLSYLTYVGFLNSEYGFGLCAVSLEPMKDCPKNAMFMDAYVAGQNGKPIKMHNIFCIFERYTGDIMWGHTETAIPGKIVSKSKEFNRF